MVAKGGLQVAGGGGQHLPAAAAAAALLLYLWPAKGREREREREPAPGKRKRNRRRRRGPAPAEPSRAPRCTHFPVRDDGAGGGRSLLGVGFVFSPRGWWCWPLIKLPAQNFLPLPL